jgi:hypothetical protein
MAQKSNDKLLVFNKRAELFWATSARMPGAWYSQRQAD